MSKFTDDYKPGDIIYGLFPTTDIYWQSLIKMRPDVLTSFIDEEKLKSHPPKGLDINKEYTKFDDVDEPLQKHILGSQLRFLAGHFHKGFKSEFTEENYLGKMSIAPIGTPESYVTYKKDYQEALFKSPLSPFKVIQISKDSGVASVVSVKDQTEYLRRACKFGVLNISNIVAGAKIRFALDGIDMKRVIEKAEIKGPKQSEAAIPITTSELRSLFRNWSKAKEHVVFYENQNEAKPPWHNDRNGWTEYAARRYKKYAEIVRLQERPELVQDELPDMFEYINLATDILKTQARIIIKLD